MVLAQGKRKLFLLLIVFARIHFYNIVTSSTDCVAISPHRLAYAMKKFVRKLIIKISQKYL